MNQEKINTAIDLIREVYKSEGCNVGGIGHIVFDDHNVEDENIDYCLSKSCIDSWDLPEESLAACIKALGYLKELSYRERTKAVRLA